MEMQLSTAEYALVWMSLNTEKNLQTKVEQT